MNEIIASIASRCSEVLDVFATDAAAGFYFHGKRSDFHVPAAGSTHAVLALIARLGAPREKLDSLGEARGSLNGMDPCDVGYTG